MVYSRKLALLIGESEFDDPGLSRLLKPTADVLSLASLLSDSSIGDFDEVIPLLNAPRNQVAEAIEHILTDRSRNDLVLIYFSGHGLRNDLDGRLYLATKDTKRERFRSTSLNASFLTELMDQCRSKTQVLILDCCHSGAFSSGMKGAGGLGESVGIMSTFQGTGVGRVVITASDATQYAWEGDKTVGNPENSIFTHFLVQGIRSGLADKNRDGVITIDELYEYVREEVVALTPRQRPQMSTFKGEGKIAIAQSMNRLDKISEAPHTVLTHRFRLGVKYALYFWDIRVLPALRVLKSFSSAIIACLAGLLLFIGISVLSLPSGHIVLPDGRTEYQHSGFEFSKNSRVSWDSGLADVLVANEPDRSRDLAQLFVQARGGQYTSATYDQNAFGGIQKMPQTKLGDVHEAPFDGYNSDWVTPKPGDIYCVRTRDGQHYAKVQITEIQKLLIGFTFVYQPLRTRRFSVF